MKSIRYFKIIFLITFAILFFIQFTYAGTKEDAERYFKEGNTYYDLGQYEKAIKSYKEAISLLPDFAEAHKGLGLSYGRLGKSTKAIVHLQEAISLKPDFGAYGGLGLVYTELGQYDKAIEPLNQAVRLNPDMGSFHFLLAIAYNHQNQSNKAVDHLKESIKLFSGDKDNQVKAQVYYHLGWSYQNLKQRDKAIVSLKEAIKLQPDYADAFMQLGLVFFEKEKEPSSLANDYFYRAGLLYLEQGNRDKALKIYGLLKYKDNELAHRLYKKLYPDE